MTNIEFDRVLVKGANTIGTVKIVMVKGDKGDVGYPTDAQVETAVNEWLNDHPEATTTVQDGSITEAKLSNDVKAELEKIDTKADAIVKTASGEIASFSDGGDGLPMKSLKVNIVPKQSGSGDPSPSNVRPISGTDTVGVTRAGKNLLPQPLESGAYATANGNPVASGSYIRSKKFYLPAGTYYISTQYCDAITMLTWNGDTYDRYFENYPSRPIFVLAEGRTVAFNFFKSEGITVADEPTVQLEIGSTATDYEPYEGESKSISLGQTVYGGTLDVVSGVLTIDTEASSFNGTENIGLETQGGHNRFYAFGRFTNMTSSPYKCSHFIAGTSPIGGNDYNNVMCSYGKAIYWRADGYATVDAMKNYFAQQNTNGTPVTLVSKIQTPTEITLTPTQVTTLLGDNNIWADSGSVEVEYRADTTLAYNELLALILENIGN